MNLPNRALRDYYQLIKEPVSLQRVHKRVRGIQGRGDPTDITEYKSWDAFEKIVSMIWKNARTYNEDGSELYNVSIELEVCHSPLVSLTSSHESRKCSTNDWTSGVYCEETGPSQR